jgi:hypothetical protein
MSASIADHTKKTPIPQTGCPIRGQGDSAPTGGTNQLSLRAAYQPSLVPLSRKIKGHVNALSQTGDKRPDSVRKANPQLGQVHATYIGHVISHFS